MGFVKERHLQRVVVHWERDAVTDADPQLHRRSSPAVSPYAPPDREQALRAAARCLHPLYNQFSTNLQAQSCPTKGQAEFAHVSIDALLILNPELNLQAARCIAVHVAQEPPVGNFFSACAAETVPEQRLWPTAPSSDGHARLDAVRHSDLASLHCDGHHDARLLHGLLAAHRPLPSRRQAVRIVMERQLKLVLIWIKAIACQLALSDATSGSKRRICRRVTLCGVSCWGTQAGLT